MRKLLLFLFTLVSISAFGQIDINITIDSGNSTTTCTDPFSSPDPLWAVNIATEGEIYYPFANNCFTALPNVQYTASYICPINVPATVEVCFKAFENDHLLAAFCEIQRSCSEEICADFAIPSLNTSAAYTLSLPTGLSSGGNVSFTISNTTAFPVIDNDTICAAVDLGLLSFNGVLGNANQGIYQNICATNLNEPTPSDFGYFPNDAGVWFSFTTGPNPSGEVLMHLLSDPNNFGAPIDLEFAIYSSSTNDCNGNFTFIDGTLFNSNPVDSRLSLICPLPNTTYFILVDGTNGSRGIFGLEVTDVGVVEGGDLRCEYEDLGAVPEGGSVETASWVSNFCATDSDDPYVGAFISQNSVWFGFIAPPSGHVLIEGITDTLVDSIGIQLALYRSFNTFCNGAFGHVMSQYDEATLDQEMEATCLYPGRAYWILVDGTGFNTLGIFKIKVSDAGDITPRTTLDTILCAGETFNIGGNSYSVSGSYADTLQLFAGCDSIVFSNITVLDALNVTIDQSPAIGESPTGVATANVNGGSGTYSYLWCNGQTAATATNLVGGQNCCVTITDSEGCELIECFDVEFITGILPVFENDTLLCFGNTNGNIRFSAFYGEPPYDYSWQQTSSGLSGSGIIPLEGEEISIPDLPVGAVSITVSDNFFDTTFIATVIEPLELIIDITDSQSASCYSFCDGSLDISASGGTGSYAYQWSNNTSSEDINNLCAGAYELVLSDQNNCETSALFNIAEPLEFIVEGISVQNVSCFEGNDGHAALNLINGTALQYQWSTNESSAEITNLSAGFYDVTVTNTDNCEAYTSVEITQPSAPLLVAIDVLNEVSCFGETDAILQAEVSGPATLLTYNWSSGHNTATAENIGAGTYTLMIVNENNCEAETMVVLTQPDEMVAEISAINITCLDPINGGSISIDTVFGGVPNYSFSTDGVSFSSFPLLEGLEEGQYEVIIRDNKGCEEIQTIIVNGPPDLLVDLGEDFEILLGETAEIEALSNSDNLIYNWTPIDSLHTLEVIINPLISTLYTVSVFDTITKCSTEDAVFVWVNKDRNVFIPNVFSPNGDGINDFFQIFGGLDVKSIKSFRIFSRFGNLLYEGENFDRMDSSVAWDGKLNGQPLNAGVYVYAAEIEFVDGITEVFKGDVLLMK